MLDPIPPEHPGESETSEHLELRMSSRSDLEGCPPPVEGGDPPMESREGWHSEGEGSPLEKVTAVQRESPDSQDDVHRPGYPTEKDGPPLDQYTNRLTPPYQNTPDENSPRVYQSSRSSYEGYMPPYDFTRQSHVPSHMSYDYRRRYPSPREWQSLQYENADLKRELAHQSRILSEKNSLLRKKDSLLFEKDSLLLEKDNAMDKLREALAQAKIEIDKAIELKSSIVDKNNMIKELMSLRNELAAENEKYKSALEKLSLHKEEPPEPPPIWFEPKEIFGWDPADLEFLSTFDFDPSNYHPDKPVFEVRNKWTRDNRIIPRMCLNFIHGRCPIGMACKFGHSTMELPPLRIHNYKQFACPRISCRGVMCNSRHGEMRRKLFRDFFLVFGGLIDAPRLCFYPSSPITEERFKKYLHQVLDILERTLPRRLLPAQVVIPFKAFG